MGTVNFYLKKPEKKTGRSLIYLQFKFGGKRLVFSFGQTIDPANWSLSKQRIRSNRATTLDGQYSLNDLLDNLERECLKAYNSELKHGVPTIDKVKGYLTGFMNQNSEDPEGPTLFKLIERFINNDIKHSGRDKTKGTLKTYIACYNRLKQFSEKEKSTIDFDTITLDFYYRFVAFLKHLGLMPNTIGKHVKALKVFMNEAIDLRYTTNLQFKNKKFVVTKEESDSVYLTEGEIMHLYRFDLSAGKRLEQVRDLFVFGCWVGLRFSDYSNVKPENLVKIDDDYFLKIKTQKTGELVIIPCNPHVMEIFKKYDTNPNKLPRSISNQKFNDFIKEVCNAAGMTEKGRLSSDPGKELWECVSSHTARRSFATNYYLEGFPTIDLMKITGHRTEAAFMKYIKITKLDTAKRLSQHIKKNWSSKLLKVAS